MPADPERSLPETKAVFVEPLQTFGKRLDLWRPEIERLSWGTIEGYGSLIDPTSLFQPVTHLASGSCLAETERKPDAAVV